jgi:hypothetical protein
MEFGELDETPEVVGGKRSRGQREDELYEHLVKVCRAPKPGQSELDFFVDQ